MTTAEILPRFKGVKKEGAGWRALCPAHDDHDPSLSIKDGRDGILLKCFSHDCSANDICAAVGLKVGDLFYKNANGKAASKTYAVTFKGATYHGCPSDTILDVYRYQDGDGQTLFQVARFVPKDFRPFHPDGRGGWTMGLGKVERILYRLPELKLARGRGLPILLPEGEKDVGSLVQQGFTATTWQGGAKAPWQDNYTEALHGADVIIIPDKDEPGRDHTRDAAKALQGKASRVRVLELPDPAKDVTEFFEAGGDAGQLQDLIDAAPDWKDVDPLLIRINERIFNIRKRPPEPVPRFHINGVPVCTPGNLTVITAAVKVGKSAAVGAMISSTMAGPDCDCLGFTASNPAGEALIHIDTEQSIFDHWRFGERALRRANLNDSPAWLRSYCLTGFTVPDLRAALPLLMREAHSQFGGIYAVVIDGGADLAADVNDPEETCALVAELHAAAIAYNCAIVVVIHFNPGSEKTRGHLGSQLERKSETNLRLDKDGETIRLWSDKNRRAPIPKDKGPLFAWSDEAGMHVSVEPGEKPNAKVKTKLDVLVHVPTEGAIDQDVLIQKANSAGIGLAKVRAFIKELLADGTVHLWLVKRPLTNPQKKISRQPQPETLTAVKVPR